MSDNARLSADFVNFTNDSERKLHELRREWLDQIAP